MKRNETNVILLNIINITKKKRKKETNSNFVLIRINTEIEKRGSNYFQNDK